MNVTEKVTQNGHVIATYVFTKAENAKRNIILKFDADPTKRRNQAKFRALFPKDGRPIGTLGLYTRKTTNKGTALFSVLAIPPNTVVCDQYPGKQLSECRLWITLATMRFQGKTTAIFNKMRYIFPITNKSGQTNYLDPTDENGVLEIRTNPLVYVNEPSESRSANCIIEEHESKDNVITARLLSASIIEPHTEITYDYGDAYYRGVKPDPDFKYMSTQAFPPYQAYPHGTAPLFVPTPKSKEHPDAPQPSHLHPMNDRVQVLFVL